ncbi:sensor histidine kinase [Agromyces archimandritae]|uniref:Oxygen sensor histidine kinase NreB n=1 Tax=Agromyces archimandritae TaxID=2781962 RepID=A0A975FPN3_9MICO|nr:sensor histidine kinase [Agromyces archimandritae]QTX04876.1 sensor histidine kinase [Agromyces archimandritae]
MAAFDAAPAPASGHTGRSALHPVFVSMRAGLHLLLVGLAVFVVVRAVLGRGPEMWAIVGFSAAFLAWYLVGVQVARRARPAWVRAGWMLVLLALWAALGLLTPDAAFLAFPLFFLELHVLPVRAGVPLVLLTFLLSIWSSGHHLGYEPGSVLGPLISAGVAIVIGLGYRAMSREAAERQALILDLVATREELQAASREAGSLAERERLAREIHDTVAQGLSSIQMLLHAAERDVADASTRQRLALAREQAAVNLAETRRFIAELTPPSLDEHTLPNALARLVRVTNEQSEQSGGGALVVFRTDGEPVALPMTIEATLLRIAQGSLANVVQHAEAGRAVVTLGYEDDAVALDVRDDGAGFDGSRADAGAGPSFGLRAIRQRAEALGGRFALETAPGEGTAVSVRIPLGGRP